jgi:hypothetical protein
MAGKIFINYRRGDEPGFALALYGRLEQSFAPEQLFMDVEGGIPAGHDFLHVLETQVAECDVLLALIGPGWLSAGDETGKRRLDNPSDFVRLEIESAMRLGRRVIPVLINKAEMPHAAQLPDTLKPLARRHAVRLTQERFRADVQGLITTLIGALREAATANPAKRSQSLYADAAQIKDLKAPLTRRMLLPGLGAAVGVGAIAVGASVIRGSRLRPPDDPLIRTFKGHSSDVDTVTFSPDGRFALSGGDDSTLKLWDIATGNVINTFSGHSTWVAPSVAFLPDGRSAVSGSADGSIKLWEVPTGREIGSFEHSGLSSIALSPDGHMVLSGGGSDHTLRLWYVATGEELRTMRGHSETVQSVAFSTDGRTVLSGGFDKTLRLWDLATGKELRTFVGHSESISSIASSADGRAVLSGSLDKTLKLWDLADW